MKLFNVILDLIFPPKCVFCSRLLHENERDVCVKCSEELPFTEGSGTKKHGEFFEICVSPLYYKENVRNSIIRYKFYDMPRYADSYAKILAECIQLNLSGKYDLITWVPLSAKRLKKRGYDQAMLLAKAVALRINTNAIPTLKKCRDIPAQSSLKGAAERRANIMNAYEVSNIDSVKGKRILLIDDIFTTGATMSECARTFLMAGADEVVCATLARTE